MAPILRDNPRGLLLARDELSGWLSSFDRYAGAKGRSSADAAHWLSMYSGESLTVDRRTGDERTIHVPSAYLSICGGIQPGTLQRAIGSEHRENGLLARFLLAQPPSRVQRWTESSIDQRLRAANDAAVDRLLRVDFAADGKPQIVTLDADAKSLWVEWHDSHATEQVDLHGDQCAAWSKLAEMPARLALVIHLVRRAAGQGADVTVCDAESIRMAISLTDWHTHETRRVYGEWVESDEQRDRRRLIEWIERRGETVTARDVQRGCGWLRESGMAEQALRDLVASGYGQWEPSRAGPGQPTRRFRLLTVDNTPVSQVEKPITVDVDTVGDQKHTSRQRVTI